MCRTALDRQGSTPTAAAHAGGHVDVPVSVTKSPGPASTVHTRISPSIKAQQLQQQILQQAPFAAGAGASTAATPRDVKHRVSNPSTVTLGHGSACSPAAGEAGNGTLLGSAGSGHWGHQLPPYNPQQQQQHTHAAGYSKFGHKPGSFLHSAAERFRQQRGMSLIRKLAVWVTVGVLGFVVLSNLAPAPRPQPAPATDVLLNLGPYFFNPSIVRHRGVYLSTARTAHMKRIDRTNWWFNEGYVCMSTTADFKTVSCRKFDPWQG